MYDTESNYASAKFVHAQKIQTIGLEFLDWSKPPYYMKVTLIPEKNFSTPILCFSPRDMNCLIEREGLVKRTNGKPAILFIKREQYIDPINEIFIHITCLEDTCSYSLIFEGSKSAEIEVNSTYSYLVTNNNKEMRFDIIGEAEEGSYLTIGVEGSYKAKLIFENIDIEPTYLDTGVIIKVPIFNKTNNILGNFIIKEANFGEYLTLNVYIIKKNKAPDNYLYPNGPLILGIIDNFSKENLNKECFPISMFSSDKFSNTNKYYLTGEIYSTYGLFWLEDENDIYLEETKEEIKERFFSYLIETNGKKRHICFGLPNQSNQSKNAMNKLAFSISLLEPTKLENLYNFYSPQIINKIYRRMIPKGSYAVYSAGKFDINDKKYSFVLYNRKGNTEMYITKCKTFPYCIYTIEDIQKMLKPKRLNSMTIWENIVNNTLGAMDYEKDVMVIYCNDNNKNYGYCEYETSIKTVN